MMKPFGSDRFGSKRWGGMRFGAGLWGIGGNVIRSINPLLWLDAADASTFTLDTGDVTQWRDKSGNGNHYSQATGSKRPSYAANAVTFDGVDEILETLFNTNTLGTNVLIAGVVETAAKTAIAFLLDGYGSGASDERWGLGVDVDPGFDDKFALAHLGDNTEEGISDVLTNNVKFAFMFDYDLTADSCDVYYNGTKSTQAVAAARTFASNCLMWLGGLNQGVFDQWYWNGKLYELAIANYDATEAKKTQINNYLMNKWGI